MRTRLAIFGAMSLLAAAYASASNLYDESADPNQQLDAALATAQSSGRLVLVQIGANWCPDARRLDAFYRAHPPLWSRIQSSFVFVRINQPREGGNPAFFSRLPAFSWVPTLMVLDGSSEVLGVAEGTSFDSESGYSESQLTAFLEGSI